MNINYKQDWSFKNAVIILNHEKPQCSSKCIQNDVCAYVVFFMLPTVFSMAQYKIVTQRFLKASVYTEKIEVTPEIFHGIPLESVA